MGTDIHAFIELSYNLAVPFSAEATVVSFTAGEIHISRDDDLFNALADRRNIHFDAQDIEKHALYPPRGLPPYTSEAVKARYYHIIDDQHRLIPIQYENHACHAERSEASRLATAETLRFAQGDKMRNI